MTPSDKFTFTYSSFILFWLYLLLEVRVSSACNDLIMQLIMRRCSQTLVMTPWTWNGHINPSGSCQSWESHLYAHEPPWILSDIAIFSKLPCHCQSHRYLTNNQAGNQTALNCQFRTWEAGNLSIQQQGKTCLWVLPCKNVCCSSVKSDAFRCLQQYLERTGIEHNTMYFLEHYYLYG